MNNKRTLNVLAFAVFFGVIGIAVFNAFKNVEKPKEEYIFDEGAKEEEKKEDPEIEETTKDYIIVTRTTYKGVYRTTIRIHSTGVIEQCTIKEDTVYDPTQEEKYIKIGELTDYEITLIKETVARMANEQKKQSNLSEGYGLEVRLTSKDKIMYSAEFFSQENTDKIYNIVKKY